MIKIKNFGPIEFKKYIKNKKIYIWGAGRAMESCLDIYFSDQSVQLVVDNNKELWGKAVVHKGKNVIIGGKDLFCQHIKKNDINNCVLMITSTHYGADIVAELDKISELDGLECFLQVVIRATKEDVPHYVFSSGEQLIPKKIHYIWIGGKEMPQEYKDNIASWRRHNPDYEIIRWDEKNYDFTKCDYVKEAYEKKCYSFASNYARLDIIHQYGGIYLDTDVECLASFDKLLKDKAFFNMGCADRINIGCGFGAVAGSDILKDMMQVFSSDHFLLPNGSPGKKTCSSYINPIMRRYGFQLENYYQKIDDVVLYPCEVMSPKTIGDMPDFMSANTLSIHHESGSWKNNEEREAVKRLEKLIRERIL